MFECLGILALLFQQLRQAVLRHRQCGHVAELGGFDVAMAASGQDCLDRVSAIAPDVITLDVMTSRADGWETAIRLRASPDTSHIKVVLITGRAQDDRTLDKQVSADAYLTMPFDPGALIHAIRKLAGTPELAPPSRSTSIAATEQSAARGEPAVSSPTTTG